MILKPRNVSVSAIEVDGHIKVWNASFTLPTNSGYLLHHESHKLFLRRIEKAVAKALEEMKVELSSVSNPAQEEFKRNRDCYGPFATKLPPRY